MTNERQKKTTEKYRNNWDQIFKKDNPPKEELSDDDKKALEQLNIPFGK